MDYALAGTLGLAVALLLIDGKLPPYKSSVDPVLHGAMLVLGFLALGLWLSGEHDRYGGVIVVTNTILAIHIAAIRYAPSMLETGADAGETGARKSRRR